MRRKHWYRSAFRKAPPGDGDGDGGGGSGGGDPNAAAIAAAVERETAALKAKNLDLVAREKKAREAAARWDGVDAEKDEVIEALKLKRELAEKKARDEGNLETWKANELKQVVDKGNAALAAEQQKTGKATAKLFDVMARRELEKAINEAGGNAKMLLPHMLPHVKVVEAHDDFVTQVVDAKGTPQMADGQGTPMTIPQLVEKFKADETFEVAFAASGASGGGARREGGGGGGGGTAVIIPKDATPQEYRRLKAEAEKAGRPYRIAS